MGTDGVVVVEAPVRLAKLQIPQPGRSVLVVMVYSRLLQVHRRIMQGEVVVELIRVVMTCLVV
jgi:hypothetical protein